MNFFPFPSARNLSLSWLWKWFFLPLLPSPSSLTNYESKNCLSKIILSLMHQCFISHLNPQNTALSVRAANALLLLWGTQVEKLSVTFYNACCSFHNFPLHSLSFSKGTLSNITFSLTHPSLFWPPASSLVPAASHSLSWRRVPPTSIASPHLQNHSGRLSGVMPLALKTCSQCHHLLTCSFKLHGITCHLCLLAQSFTAPQALLIAQSPTSCLLFLVSQFPPAHHHDLFLISCFSALKTFQQNTQCFPR